MPWSVFDKCLQLKREASVQREKTSVTIKDLLQYVEKNQKVTNIVCSPSVGQRLGRFSTSLKWQSGLGKLTRQRWGASTQVCWCLYWLRAPFSCRMTFWLYQKMKRQGGRIRTSMVSWNLLSISFHWVGGDGIYNILGGVGPEWGLQAVVAESLIRIAKGLDDFDSDEKLKEKLQTILNVKNSASFQQFFQHIESIAEFNVAIALIHQASVVQILVRPESSKISLT